MGFANLADAPWRILWSGVAAIAVTLAMVPIVSAEDVDQTSTPPPNARFEIVQSLLNLRDTFRLDRWSGATEILTEGKEAFTWTSIPFVGPPNVTPSGSRFQLTLSSVSAKGTYLIDTATGATWVLTGNSISELRWQPVR
jgi:hypothetical protein